MGPECHVFEGNHLPYVVGDDSFAISAERDRDFAPNADVEAIRGTGFADWFDRTGGDAATPFDFIELTSPEETPDWATDLTELEGTTASPFVFTESRTPDNVIAMYIREDRTIFDENKTPSKRFI